jgi:hypothetical protein
MSCGFMLIRHFAVLRLLVMCGEYPVLDVQDATLIVTGKDAGLQRGCGRLRLLELGDCGRDGVWGG